MCNIDRNEYIHYVDAWFLAIIGNADDHVRCFLQPIHKIKKKKRKNREIAYYTITICDFEYVFFEYVFFVFS